VLREIKQPVRRVAKLLRMQTQGRAAWYDRPRRIGRALHLEGPVHSNRPAHRLQRGSGERSTDCGQGFRENTLQAGMVKIFCEGLATESEEKFSINTKGA